MLRLYIAQAAFICAWCLLFRSLGLYKQTYALSMKDEIYYIAAALSLGIFPQLLLFTIYPGISASRIALLATLVVSVALVGASRTILHGMRSTARLRPRRRVAVVGTVERIQSAGEALDISDDDASLFVPVEDIDQTIGRINVTRDPNLENVEWFTRARSWGCDTLILTEIPSPAVMPHLLDVAARNSMRLAFAAPRIKRYSYSLSLQTEGHQALIVPTRLGACTPRAQLFKRMMDVALGSLALIVFAPVMLLGALAVYLESGTPVLFVQERVGQNGRIFNVFKFRSMRHNAEAQSGAVWASSNDSRRTRIGAFLRRFSIDEMPQLFNVLRGDMSLVGPRPERPVFVEQFRKTLLRYDERHLVRPGITGWSQVHMERVLDPSAAAEKLAYDLQYVEHWSPFLDLSVLFQTLVEFAFHRAG